MKYIVLAVVGFLIITYFIPRDSRNPRYAADFFANKTGVDEVIASKRSYDDSDGWRGCLFAIVRIPEQTAEKLRSNGPSAVADLGKDASSHILKWPRVDQWQSTPLPPQSPHDDDAFLSCTDRLKPEHVTEIREALANPNSWAFRSWYRVAILAPDARLAAIFRYGD